jgi:hypothetical protein
MAGSNEEEANERFVRLASLFSSVMVVRSRALLLSLLFSSGVSPKLLLLTLILLLLLVRLLGKATEVPGVVTDEAAENIVVLPLSILNSANNKDVN